MKKVMTGLSLVLFVSAAWAQDRVPTERVQRLAQLLVEQAAQVKDAPIKTDGNTEKPYAVRSGRYAVVAIPDRKLSSDAMAKIGKGVLPVGQLWLVQLSPVVEGKATPNDKLLLVTVNLYNEDHKLPLCLLGVQKNAEGALELVVYAKAKEPLLKLPLKKMETKQEMPIELHARGEGETGSIDINVLGKHQATLTVAEQES